MNGEETAQPTGSSVISQQSPNREFTHLQLLTSDILEDIEHQLKGEIYNEEKDEWVNKGEKLILVDKGIHEVLTHMYTFLNRNVILSELSDPEIRTIMQVLDEEITYFLAEKADIYTNNDITKLDLIKRIITHTAFFSLKRALNRGEGQLLKDTVTRVEHYDTGGGGILSKLSPFGKK